jgi:hypothetical protein
MFAGFRCDYHPIRVPDTTAEFKQNPHWQPASQSWSLFDCLPMQRPQNVMIKLPQTVFAFRAIF